MNEKQLLLFFFVMALCFDTILFRRIGNRAHPMYWIGMFTIVIWRFYSRKLKFRLSHSPRQQYYGSLIFVFMSHVCVQSMFWFGSIWLQYAFSEIIVFMIMSFFFATSFSLATYRNHALCVKEALERRSLSEARQKVGKIVGRKVNNLSRCQVIRACVESIAENLCDSLIAPFFYWLVAFIFLSIMFDVTDSQCLIGAVASAIFYRQVNLMDALFGHKTSELRYFGWASARLDDLLNIFPARISALCIFMSALFYKLFVPNAVRLSPLQGIYVFWRDRHKHPSPNAGQGEAAMAGVLQIVLGGTNTYHGEKKRANPYIGKLTKSLSKRYCFTTYPLIIAHISIALNIATFSAMLGYTLIIGLAFMI